MFTKKQPQKNDQAIEIDQQIPTWDLRDFYSGIDDINIKKDLEEIAKKTTIFCQEYRDHVAKLDAEKLAQAIANFENICESGAKLTSYSYLVYSSDLSKEKNIAFNQNINEEISKYESQLVFFTIELNEISEERIKQLLENSSLKKYQSFLRDVSFFKKHQLSKELEKFIVEKNITSRSAFIRLFDETVNNLQFPYQDRQLNSQEIFNLLSNKDAKIRQESAKSIAQVFEKNIKIFAFITNIMAKDKAIEDQYRNFKTPISSRNLCNFIEDEIIDVLQKTVKDNYHATAHRYYKIKAKLLNQEHLNYWDRNAPISFNKDQNKKKYSFQEAQKLVIEAYAEFHPQMAEIAQQFFDKNWIDAQVRNGKDSGAYSHPCVTSIHPYILMNFQGTSRDVMTLAHELGHGIHQFLARKQGFLQCSTPLTLAETASVFGEQLVFQKILKNETDFELKKIIIADKIEDMINTVIRQIAFLDFEKKIHDERKNGEIDIEKINLFWLEIQKESLGEAFVFEDEYRFFWCYISHFIHAPFYVYSYAFGDCLVNSLYSIYKSSKITDFNSKYLNMLELGGVHHYKEMLKPFGLDISKAEFWQSGLNVIIDYIDQLEKIS